MILKYAILTWPTNPILRAVADPIVVFDDGLRQLAKDMKTVCKEHDGVGLAAPQIGLSIRIIYTTQWKNGPDWLVYTGDQIMINPEILEYSDNLKTDVEWCLSLPGLEWKVKRPLQIKVKFQDLNKKEFIKSFSGFNARIIQHEVDHLNGVLFIDKATNIVKVMSM